MTGESVVHRLPAGSKLIALTAASLALFAVDSLAGSALAAGVVLLTFVAAGCGVHALRDQTRAVLPVAVLLLAVQTWSLGWQDAVVVTARVLLLVALAGLVTLTTRTTELLSTIERAAEPGRRWGVRPDRLALTLSLAIRGIPVLTEVAGRVQDAQRARGRRDVRAFAVPVVVGALRRADAVSEALAARGLDD